ncbi:MAG: hypothetical protein HOY76_52290 [Streptomyces sp.]|nr:hypothetical protein [Streptomyces sp.]NUS83504.1 hypothetical protein [Streptomyces sp.]
MTNTNTPKPIAGTTKSIESGNVIAVVAEPAPNPLQQLVDQLRLLPRRLARQELTDEEKLGAASFNSLYAEFLTAHDAIAGRKPTPAYPPFATRWSDAVELQAQVITHVVNSPSKSEAFKVSIRIDGVEKYTYPGGQKPTVAPGGYLVTPVSIPKGPGPFAVTGSVVYKDTAGETRTYSPDTTVSRRRLSLSADVLTPER